MIVEQEKYGQHTVHFMVGANKGIPFGEFTMSKWSEINYPALPDDPSTAVVHSLGIPNTADRGKGLSHIIMQDVEAMAQKLGYTHLKLWVNNKNYVARHLYESHGWQYVPEREEDWGVLWMTKEIGGQNV